MTQRYSLRFENGERQGELVPVPAFPFAIGRKPGNALQILDASVSGKHAELVLDGQSVVVRDLGSTNGTRVGSERVVESAVPAGSSFTLGNITVVLLDAESPAGTSPAVPVATPARPEVSAAAEVRADRADADLVARAGRGSKTGALLLLALAATAAGVWYFQPATGGRAGREARAVPAFDDSLLAATFEDGAPLEASSWAAEGGAEGTFVISARAAFTGEEGISASLEEGESALAVSPSVQVRPGEGLQVVAEMRAPDEALGRLGVKFSSSTDAVTPIFAWSESIQDQGSFEEVSMRVDVPSGYDQAHLVLLARGSGRVHADDVRLEEAEALGTSLAADPFRFVRVGKAWNLFLVDRTLLSNIALRAAGASPDDRQPITATSEANGVRFEHPGGALSMHVEPRLAEGGLATLGPGGYTPRAEEFEVQATDLVIGSGVDLVRIALGAEVAVRGRTVSGGWRISIDLPAQVAPLIQVRFDEEREATVNLVTDAEQAERAGDLGACLEAWRELLDRFPFEEALVNRAQTERARHLQVGFSELTAVDETLERADFFQLPELFQQCREKVVAIRERFANSEVAEASNVVLARIDESLDQLGASSDELEVDRRKGILNALQRSGASHLAEAVGRTLEGDAEEDSDQ